jgi:hypothetical protein
MMFKYYYDALSGLTLCIYNMKGCFFQFRDVTEVTKIIDKMV